MHFTSDVKEALNHKYSDIADEMIKDGKDIVSLCVGARYESANICN